MTTVPFQRARTPGQVASRRATILGAARELLTDRRSAEVSLGDIGQRVGLAKSNVLRYFDSREAILLEVLDAQWCEWLDDLGSNPVDPSRNGGAFDLEGRLASAIADSLSSRPVLCELISVMAGVLERNIDIDYARHFKHQAAQHTSRLARVVHGIFPSLSAAAADQFAGAVFVVTAGLWPYALPTPTIAAVSAEMGISDSFASFRRNLRNGLTAQLIGLVAQA